MAKNKQTIAFWKFLRENKIEIPIIQRDYAQGRIGKEQLRAKFLADLKAALDNKLPEKTLTLDFVYGSVENALLNPLDGQQRLTTLWLLHWYIAYKAEKLFENKNIFKKFSYETRTSSREFCEKLSDFTEQPLDGKGIVEHIQNQTWFFSAWKQDPTIQAMLNMLGGTTRRNDKNEDIVDGIEEVFKDCKQQDAFKKYWEQLIFADCPIIFYYLPLHDYGLSDDLYIKMNARGKSLTSFENFKADLVGHIKDKKWEETKPQETIAHKLDTTWTDIFWKNNKEGKIDDIYFAFINRYFLNALITAKKDNDYLFKSENWEKENKTFQFLYGKEGNDSAIVYNGYDVYNPKIGNGESEEVFLPTTYQNLTKTLDNFYYSFKDSATKDITDLFLPAWGDDKFKFIPEYQADNSITTLTRSQRVAFYAICGYFENNSYDEILFKQWMRVVWNIVENSDSDSNMIGAIRLIDELKQYTNDIYTHLKEREIKNSDFASEQMKEEKEKARQILDNPNENWENKIIEAENTAFFKGAIRFMFTKEDGTPDWSLFGDRFKKSTQYFDDKGVKGDYKKTDALLLRVLISKFDQKDHFSQIYFNSKPNNWKDKILTNKKLNGAVCALFNESICDGYNFDAFSPEWTDDERLRMCHKDLLTRKFLEKFDNEDKVLWFDHGGKHVLHVYRHSDWIIIGDKRNEILSKLMDDKVITSTQKIQDVPYFWGWDINFEYNGKKYQWNADDYIYLLDEKFQRVKDEDGNDIRVPYNDVNAKDIISKLDKLCPK